jgi:hypothetical protein
VYGQLGAGERRGAPKVALGGAELLALAPAQSAER